MSFSNKTSDPQHSLSPTIFTKSKSDDNKQLPQLLKPRITVNFYDNLSSIQDSIDFDLKFDIVNIIGRENSFLSIEGTHAKTFFLIGFILIKRVFMEEYDQARIGLKRILSSFNSLQKYLNYTDANNNLAISQTVLKDFFNQALGPNRVINFNKDEDIVSNLLCSQSQADKAFLHSIAQAGRGLIAEHLAPEIDSPKLDIFSRVTTLKDWALDDTYSDELLQLFAEAFDFRIELNSNSKSQRQYFGKENTKRTITLLRYYSETKDSSYLLYKVTNKQSPNVIENWNKSFSPDASPNAAVKQRVQPHNSQLQLCSAQGKITNKVVDNSKNEDKYKELLDLELRWSLVKKPKKPVKCPLCEFEMQVDSNVYSILCGNCNKLFSANKADQISKCIFMCPRSFDLLKTNEALHIKYCAPCSTPYCIDCSEVITYGRCRCQEKNLGDKQRGVEIQCFLENIAGNKSPKPISPVIQHDKSPVVNQIVQQKAPPEEDNQQKVPPEEDKQHEGKSAKLKDEIGEEVECSICIDYIYKCVTAWPCLHNFCAACFSDLMQKSKLCPVCQEEIWAVKRNPIMTNIIERFLDNYPKKRRPKEEYEAMDRKDLIKQEMVKFK